MTVQLPQTLDAFVTNYTSAEVVKHTAFSDIGSLCHLLCLIFSGYSQYSVQYTASTDARCFWH